MTPEPSEDNAWMQEQAGLILRCYRHWTGRDLIDATRGAADAARALYLAPFVVLSHDAAADPRFTYANLAAQRLFEMTWAEIVGLPSRYSAEPLAREERERLLARVAREGYADDYSGGRISRTGRRFLVQRATVWNLFDGSGAFCGQAAAFSDWQMLGDPTLGPTSGAQS